MSLWRKRKDVHHDEQKPAKLFSLSIKSDDLSIKQSKGIDMSKEAMKLALEAFKDLEKHRCLHYPNIVKALEEALAKQDEPVTVTHRHEWFRTGDLIRKGIEASRLNFELLSALSACLDWMEDLRTSGDAGNWRWQDDVYTKGRTVEAKLKEKNT